MSKCNINVMRSSDQSEIECTMQIIIRKAIIESYFIFIRQEGILYEAHHIFAYRHKFSYR